MAEPTTDELLDGLTFRDFLVLVMHTTGQDPRSLRSLMQLRRGLFFVRAAEQRLAARGLLLQEDGQKKVTPDGTRAVRTGAVLFELEHFDASRY